MRRTTWQTLEIHTLKYDHFSLQDIVIERILGGKNSVLGPLLLKLLFASLKKMSPSIH